MQTHKYLRYEAFPRQLGKDAVWILSASFAAALFLSRPLVRFHLGREISLLDWIVPVGILTLLLVQFWIVSRWSMAEYWVSIRPSMLKGVAAFFISGLVFGTAVTIALSAVLQAVISEATANFIGVFQVATAIAGILGAVIVAKRWVARKLHAT